MMSLLISKGKRNPIPNNLGPNFNPFLFNNRFFPNISSSQFALVIYHLCFFTKISEIQSFEQKSVTSYNHHLPTTLPSPTRTYHPHPPPCHVVHASVAQNPPKNPRSGPRGRPRLTHRPMNLWSDITQLGRGSHNPILKGLTIQ